MRKPVLITHGENDAVVGIGIAKYNAEKVKHAKTSYYPKVGHAPFWEEAERFNRELRAFALSV